MKKCAKPAKICYFLPFVCWNRQIWSNLNAFVIIGDGQIGGIPPYPLFHYLSECIVFPNLVWCMFVFLEICLLNLLHVTTENVLKHVKCHLNVLKSSGVATGGSRGKSAPLDSKESPKRGENLGKVERSGRKGKNREGSFILPLLTDRAGYATVTKRLFSTPRHCSKLKSLSTQLDLSSLGLNSTLLDYQVSSEV